MRYDLSLKLAASFSKTEMKALLKLKKISNKEFLEAFKMVVNAGNVRTAKWLLELGDKSSADIAIVNIFGAAARDGKSDVVKLLLKWGSEKISNEKFSDGLKMAALNGHEEVIKLLWELGSEKISNKDFSSGFWYSKDIKVAKLLWELGKERISDEDFSSKFMSVAYKGELEDVKFIWDLAKEKISNEKFSATFRVAAAEGKPDVVKLLWELGKEKISNQEFSVALKWSISKGYVELQNFLFEKMAPEVKKLLSDDAMKSGDKELIKKLIDLGCFAKGDNIKLIGFSNYVGEWSRNVIDYIKKDNEIGVVSLDLKDTINEKFLSIFDGFINPGAGDTFPILEAFDLSYLNPKYYHKEHEYAYQNIINFAKVHSVPYLGLCNGAQHLILNNGGFIAKALTPHNLVPHTLKVEQGSIVHFLAMNEQEQELAITKGYFPDMEFLINTQHNFAGVNGRIGSLELGGLSDEGVVEAVALKFHQVGFQFHPENMYYNMEDKVFGRNGNLLKNTFKFFTLDNKSVDLNKVHDYMFAQLKEAFAKAVCEPNELNTCPVSEGLARDIFAEAVSEATY